jgi:hypothetical protein
LSYFNTAKGYWEKLSKEYKAKRTYAQYDLEVAFFKMTCPKGGNVRTFLMDLRYKREVLAAAGMHITDKEYQGTLLRGIPDECEICLAVAVRHAPCPPCLDRRYRYLDWFYL